MNEHLENGISVAGAYATLPPYFFKIDISMILQHKCTASIQSQYSVLYTCAYFSNVEHKAVLQSK